MRLEHEINQIMSISNQVYSGIQDMGIDLELAPEIIESDIRSVFNYVTNQNCEQQSVDLFKKIINYDHSNPKFSKMGSLLDVLKDNLPDGNHNKFNRIIVGLNDILRSDFHPKVKFDLCSNVISSIKSFSNTQISESLINYLSNYARELYLKDDPKKRESIKNKINYFTTSDLLKEIFFEHQQLSNLDSIWMISSFENCYQLFKSNGDKLNLNIKRLSNLYRSCKNENQMVLLNLILTYKTNINIKNQKDFIKLLDSINSYQEKINYEDTLKVINKSSSLNQTENNLDYYSMSKDKDGFDIGLCLRYSECFREEINDSEFKNEISYNCINRLIVLYDLVYNVINTNMSELFENDITNLLGKNVVNDKLDDYFFKYLNETISLVESNHQKEIYLLEWINETSSLVKKDPGLFKTYFLQEVMVE
ncbi:hypothetical protein HN385_03380 [archaeon]|jgi:hypothetical protein|nr:hypothetical protein [archaeon]MBT3451488.1 hypothetical protein [archaeon]MBT6869738.1 hypothetical protein [archaeon]MBT7192693.1 hypothetical protein [archaeon]MBT7380718.1 hypothetical protein [archaeon]